MFLIFITILLFILQQKTYGSNTDNSPLGYDVVLSLVIIGKLM
jgi:hypothetical protein